MDPGLIYVVAGAFAAAFAIGSVGFADALILNAIWLHFLAPTIAVPLVVACGFLMHVIPLYRLRKALNFSKLPPFVFCGVLGVPVGVWGLSYIDAGSLKLSLGMLLIVYGVWVFWMPPVCIGSRGGRYADGSVGFLGGVLGGLAGLSGTLPTLWAGLRGWHKHTQRGAYQPFVLIMHALGIVFFIFNGMLTEQVIRYLVWCLPAIILGSWVGSIVYPRLDEILFKRIIVGLIFLSGISLII